MGGAHLSCCTRARMEDSIQKKEKAEKVYFYLRHKNLNEANLDQIFSESRSGTIAYKNQKRITAGTQLKEFGQKSKLTYWSIPENTKT